MRKISVCMPRETEVLKYEFYISVIDSAGERESIKINIVDFYDEDRRKKSTKVIATAEGYDKTERTKMLKDVGYLKDYSEGGQE